MTSPTPCSRQLGQLPRFNVRAISVCAVSAFCIVSQMIGGLPFEGRVCGAENAWQSLMDESWDFEMNESPLWATRVGDHRANDKLDSVGLSDAHRRLAARKAFLQRANAIDRASLSQDDRLNYDIWLRLLKDQITEAEFASYLIPISNRSGFHIEFLDLRKQAPLITIQDHENFVSRLSEFDRYAQQHIEVMREGIRRGMTLPAVVLDGFDETVSPHIVDRPEDSLLFEPFKVLPKGISHDSSQQLANQARQAITSSVVPGYRRFLAFMQKEYIPHARDSISASTLPKGREFYQHRVRRFTTLDMSPEQVHGLGQAEVNRIRGEMLEVIRDAKFTGTFAEFLQFLRTDERFQPKTPDELLKEVAYVLKKMDGELPRLFRTLPKTPYGIRKIPDYIAPKTTTAYYMPPAGDGSTAGFYYVNTYNLKSRPLYEVQALSLHEAVPGHHLQIALQQELDIPPFRRYAGFTAFVEGWGLYSERLGLEVGFYEDPYDNFGRLTYEMWRACRLVVDTGMHYLGWSRQQAIDFMAENSALSLHNIRSEVDRYIAWPGQALAYKVGEIKIRKLRTRAENELGEKFDIRAFHDVVLTAGSVPLDILETRVNEYIAANK